MVSFKTWVNEDIAKAVGSSGVDANPVRTGNSAMGAVRNYAADPNNSNDINRVMGASGVGSTQRAITNIVPKIAQYQATPIRNQKYTTADISSAFDNEFFGNQMRMFMRKAMAKKMKRA